MRHDLTIQYKGMHYFADDVDYEHLPAFFVEAMREFKWENIGQESHLDQGKKADTPIGLKSGASTSAGLTPCKAGLPRRKLPKKKKG